MGLVSLALLLLAGYSAWRLLGDRDRERRKAYLQGVLWWTATIALGYVAFRSGLPWLVGLVLVAYLLNRSGVLRKWTEKPSGEAPPRVIGDAMTRDKALGVLGLSDDATEREINDRYRELMRRVHPDQGGSSYLATELNEARRVLLDARP
jgi:hypothetical protein